MHGLAWGQRPPPSFALHCSYLALLPGGVWLWWGCIQARAAHVASLLVQCTVQASCAYLLGVL